MRLGLAVAACFGVVLAGCGGSSPGGGSTTAPVLAPTANPGGPYTGSVGTPVSFNGSASSDPQSEPLTYAWNFGDGGTGTGVNPTHTYAQVAGVASSTYTVTLNVMDTYGLTGQKSTTATIQGLAPLTDAALTGTVATGQNAIVGAHVYLFAANTTGYGGSGIAASSGNASVSLLSAAQTGTSDSVGAYVLTGSSGTYTMSGDYTCTTGQQLYIYALGGYSGTAANASSGLMAAIGSCPSSSSSVVAWVNEVSTVAAAYSFAGFATDSLHVSSPNTALALTGIANAFANAANLVKLSTGAALATTPAGNGAAPQAEINTLANILSTCVNPSNSVTGICNMLFVAAPAGGNSGANPADTATAAINIAHFPAADVSDLYDLPITTPPYSPALSREPNDFTVALTFTGGGLSGSGLDSIAIDGAGNAWVTSYYGNSVMKLSSLGAPLSGTAGYTGGGLNAPTGLAIDLSGDAWVANFSGASVTEFSNGGSVLSGTSGYTGGGLNRPYGVAVDGTGNVWVANEVGTSVTKLSSSGGILSGTNGYSVGGAGVPWGIAIDSSGNAWVSNDTGTSVTKLSSTGTASSFSGGGLADTAGVAIDSSGNAWFANSLGMTVTELSTAGAVLSGASGFSAVGLSTPLGIAFDGSDNAWITDSASNTITELNGTGSNLSTPDGYVASSLGGPGGVAIDGSGNVWIANRSTLSGNSVTELVGAGTPTVTPLAVAVKNNALGARP